MPRPRNQLYSIPTYDAIFKSKYEEDTNYDRISEYTKGQKQKSREEGLKEGRKEGEAIGRKEGEAKERARAEREKIEMIKKMAQKGFSLKDIAECTGLTIAEIEEILGVLQNT